MWRGGLFGASIILSFLMPAASLKVCVPLVQRTAKALKAEL